MIFKWLQISTWIVKLWLRTFLLFTGIIAFEMVEYKKKVSIMLKVITVKYEKSFEHVEKVFWIKKKRNGIHLQLAV